MDALTWFKSVLHRGLATPAPLRAEVASEMWPEVPLHLAAARLRPVAPADDDEDWDAVIARAKIQAAEMQATPPPLAAPPAPALWTAKLKAARVGAPQEVRARLDAVWERLKKPAAPEDQATPPPLANADRRQARVSSTRSAPAGSRSAGRRSP